MSEHTPQQQTAPVSVPEPDQEIIPTSWEQMKNSNTLKATDLTRPMTFTIVKLVSKRLPDDKGKLIRKGVITFKNGRVWIFGETNAQCLRQLFKVESPQDVVGKRITLCSEQVALGRNMTDGVRIAGSPDISEDVVATIRLARKKPFERRMTVTRA